MNCRIPYIIKYSLLLFGLLSVNLALSQKRPDPVFDTFRGDFYSMPIVEVKSKKLTTKGIQEKYGENIYDYKKLGGIELDEVNIPETTMGTGKFPGVDRSVQFCMVLHSTMTIEVDGCYEFSLHSDDGSILWIDDEIVIDNDGGHQMQLSKDTIALTQGDYAIKLWYFQGMPDRFGFIFDSKLVGEISACGEKREVVELKIESKLLFNSGSYVLNNEATSVLSNLTNSISQHKIKSIDIIGYTDNVGSQESNLRLSQLRAEAISNEFRKVLVDNNVPINATGQGESNPVSSNDTKEGRNKNRRVEIMVWY